MIAIIQILLQAISPHLRDLILNFVKDLSVQAAKTPNPWDDILVAILKTVLDIKD